MAIELVDEVRCQSRHFPLASTLHILPSPGHGVLHIWHVSTFCVSNEVNSTIVMTYFYYKVKVQAHYSAKLLNSLNVFTFLISIKVTRHLYIKNNKNLQPQHILAFNSANKP